ncbi:endonuclease/exonuclease/phosphatase family protein [Asticcacaulis solisilvae]|uniref:endonuclease/exonuclease/phosphatase family protein n=1 Tax=Asticcacaulis solisilvae TaxID=1217274 RepID=UPI003FD88D7E
MAFFRVLAATGLVISLAAGLASCFSGWPGDMITPFRVQLLVAGVAGLGVAAVVRQRWILMLAAAALAVNALPMAVRGLDRPVLPATASHSHAVSLVFSKVLCDNRDFDRVTAMAAAQDADIFAAAETTPEWTRHLEVLKARYPYSFTPSMGIFGVSLYAKRPFTPALYRLGRHRMPLIRADFGDMVVYVAHPMPPANARLTFDNEDYIRDLAGLVGHETRPVIVAGDLMVAQPGAADETEDAVAARLRHGL